MFGGTITSISTPVNDSPAPTCSLTADEYETVTITYSTTTSSAHNVMLLFGGHLAAGGGTRSWGAGKGSSSINGGPYHIKLTTLDASSVGNRDNQISSSAILPLATGVSTTLHQTNSTGSDVNPQNNESGTAGLTVNMPSGGGGVYVTDYATVTPTGATGTVDFAYYSTSTACNAATNASEGGTSAGTGKTLNSSGVAVSDPQNFTSIGTIYWKAFFQGTDISTDSMSACSEEVLTVNQNTAASTLLHQTDSSGADLTTANNAEPLTVPVNSYVVDYATVTPSAATGSVTFKLYTASGTTTASAACTADTAGAGGTGEGGTASSTAGTWTSTVYQATTAGDFYWRAVFSGTGGNNGSVSACEHLIVQKGSPTVASDPRLIPQDHATLAGVVALTGSAATIQFTLYGPTTGNTPCGGSVVYTDPAQAATAAGTFSTSNSGDPATNSGFKLTSSSTHGTYWWRVNYTGDASNNANNTCSEAFDFEGITDKLAG